MSAHSLFKASPDLRVIPQALAKKNFGLSEPQFKELAAAMAAGNQRLFERIFLNHFEDCSAYLRLKDRATPEEAYDSVMNTLLQFKDLITAGKIHYGNLRYLFTRMARQELGRQRKRKGRFTPLAQEVELLPEEECTFDQETYALLSRAYQSLGKECRELLRAFYYQRKSLKQIAEEEDRSAPAVRKQKSRCITTLRRYFYRIS